MALPGLERGWGGAGEGLGRVGEGWGGVGERLEKGLAFKTSKSLFTLQPETIAKLIPKTFFHVIEMRFSKKRIPKRVFHANSLNRKRIHAM